MSFSFWLQVVEPFVVKSYTRWKDPALIPLLDYFLSIYDMGHKDIHLLHFNYHRLVSCILYLDGVQRLLPYKKKLPSKV